MLAPATIATQTTEANQQHLDAKKNFETYHAVDKALHNQILEAIPEVYFHSLHNTTTCNNEAKGH
jgi:hypothetical protein